MSEQQSYQALCGWRGIDATQQRFARQFPGLRQAAPHLFGDPVPTGPILLYKAWEEVLGSYPAYPAQQIGDCVSFGHGHGNDLLQCIESRLGVPVEYRETDTEFIYGASRQAAGILGTSDGSYGAAAVKAMTTIGMVFARCWVVTEPIRVIGPKRGERPGRLRISKRRPHLTSWARPPWFPPGMTLWRRSRTVTR